MRCKKTFVLAITLLMGLAIPARADFDDGKAAFEQGDYTTALREWKPLAEHGDREAQYWLAQMYARGTGVPQDYREALWWLRKAAKKGHVRANFAIGHMHQYGQGVPPGFAEAAEWYRRAAEMGYPEAAYRLANFYAFGQGVWKDDNQAFMWFHIALSTDREMMLAGQGRSMTDLAREAGVGRTYFCRVVRLGFLAPDAVQAILRDRHPPDLTAKRLSLHTKLPAAWADQIAALGIA